MFRFGIDVLWLTNMLLPVLGLVDQTITPAVRPRDLEPVEGGRSGSLSQRFEAEGIRSEYIDDIA